MIFIILACIVPFFIQYMHERRTLWLGFWFLLAGFVGYFWALMLAYSSGIQPLIVTLIIIGIIALVLLLLSPFLTLLSLFYSGIMVIRREGFNLVNSLALVTGIGLIGYIFIWPMFANLSESSIFNRLYVYVSFVVLYLIMLVVLYTVTNLLNFIHLVPVKVDYIIVLGAGLIGTKVTPLLASRINGGIRLLTRNPQAKLILSGGQGPDEVIAEGEAMRLYALEQGVTDNRIIVENQSRNTQENLRYSMALISEADARVVVVTNFYHVLRALLIAKSENIRCIGYGTRTKLYFSINAFLREFVGYLVFTQKTHKRVLAAIAILSISVEVITFLITVFG